MSIVVCMATATSPPQGSRGQPMYAAHHGRRQVVFLMCHCGPIFPRNDTAASSGSVFPEHLNDTEWLQRQLMTCRRIVNDTSTKKARKLLSYVMRRRHIRLQAKVIVEAADELVGLAILETTELAKAGHRVGSAG